MFLGSKITLGQGSTLSLNCEYFGPACLLREVRMVDLQKSNSPHKAIWQWWLGLTGFQSSLGYCGEEAIERVAHDVGVSTSELRALAERGPQSADLLLRRMEALDLEQ